MFWFLYYMLLLPSKMFMPVKVIGKKNYNKKQNYVIVCNHRSAFDPIIMNFKFKKRIRFMAKKELWKGKVKSYLYDNILGCIAIDRENGLTLSTTKTVFDILKNNECLGIFPEGTRKDAETNIEVKDGACLFAIKSKKPVLPCFIVKKQKLFRKNILIIGEPFELSEFYDKKLDKECLSQAGEVLANKIMSLKENYYKDLEEKQLKKKKHKLSKTINKE